MALRLVPDDHDVPDDTGVGGAVDPEARAGADAVDDADAAGRAGNALPGNGDDVRGRQVRPGDPTGRGTQRRATSLLRRRAGAGAELDHLDRVPRRGGGADEEPL